MGQPDREPRKNGNVDETLMEEGYRRATDLLEQCTTEFGFLASPTEHANYRRIWARDGCITSIGAMLTGRTDMIETARQTLETLIRYQGPHGEIPSNVDPWTERVSYGGTAGRVDADLWFLICCGEYWRHSEDNAFIEENIEAIEKVRALLGAWEFNNRGFLYVPQTGDWADEYVNHGYVFYDQVLYVQAQRVCALAHEHIHGSGDHELKEKIARLKHMIRGNYWLTRNPDPPDDVYHNVIYQKGQKVADELCERHWMSFFTPAGYGYRFDSLAHALVSLFGIADDAQREAVDQYVEQEVVQKDLRVLPAFHPIIQPTDADWEDLQMTFSYTFKNKPNEYHNGGLWPFVTGFYAADLAKRGQRDLARRYLEGIHAGNRIGMDGLPWAFAEFIHGQKHTAGGTPQLAWNAAGAVMAHEVLNNGKDVLPKRPDMP